MTDQTAATPEWHDGDPLMEAIAAAVWEHCHTAGTCVSDDPRNIAAAAAAGIRDAARQATGQPDTEQPVVAYRDPNNPRVLLCRQHGQSWHAITPATAEDLPDGGICTFGRLSSNECGRDVLATSTPAVGQPAAPADRAAETEARDTDVTWSVVFITDSGDAWQEWSKGWHRIEDALVSGENVAGIATVAEVRFVRTTTVRERFNLHQLAAGTES